MSRWIQIIFSSLILLLGWHHTGQTQKQNFSSLKNVKTRAMAMGCAFTSITDDLTAVYYNPAAFELYSNPKNFRITCFLNPILSYLAFSKYSDNFRHNITKKQLLNASASLLKAVVFSVKYFNIGFILGEESLQSSINDKNLFWLDFNECWNNSAHTFVTNFKFAKRASIGVNGSFYYHNQIDSLKDWLGFSYGILLKPNDRLNVGLAYVDYPDKLPDFRYPIERMADETMNMGVSLKLWSGSILSMDIRNLTEEEKQNVRELHLGIEQNIFQIAALRCGYFRDRPLKEDYFSFGIGIFDSNLIFNESNEFAHHNFMINYSLITRENLDKLYQYHFLSFILRI